MGMPGIPYVLEYVKNILNIRYARNTLSTILAHWHIRTQSTIVCQEYQKHMGMLGIPYVLEYIRNILSTRYARNTLSTICTRNIKYHSMPESLGLWVCQAYLMCWNMCWNILYKRYARNTLCKMLVSIFFIYIKLLCFIIFKTIASQCSSYHIVPHYSHLVGKSKMTVYIHKYDRRSCKHRYF